MTDEELSRALRGHEPPADPEHQTRLEQELLAAYDARRLSRARPGRAPWLRYATAACFLACLITATQVTAEYKLEVGKRIQLVLPTGREPAPDLNTQIAQAFVSEGSHLVDVQAMLRRMPEGPAMLVVDVWGDQLLPEREGLERLRALPELAGLSPEVTSLQGRVRHNLLGALRHSLFRAGATPDEREQARQRLIQELQRQEGEGALIDVDVTEDPEHPRMRVRIRKPPPGPSPSP
ncbi:hypothetical protein [Hyalangium versicolor]|uniref:hypothetical protein n=1 Tax=Hyalangium versicolor TaxID=2861190 RepID=UPI001CCD176B|nr:hypothetical protein [Hyalangium versicolor]